MRILLTCCLGMSSSLLVEMMNLECINQNKNYQIECVDQEQISKYINQADVLLLGPQILHTKKTLLKKYGHLLPIAMISHHDYGTLNGKNVLKQAENLYFEFQASKQIK